MRMTINRLLPVICAAMLVCGGCAKQEVVRKDEPVAPSAAKTAETAASKSAALTPGAPDKPGAALAANSSPLEKKSQQSGGSTATSDVRKALERIYFDFDSTTLGDAARQTLTRNFEVLKQDPLAVIRIEGHCDERGSDEYNLALGERRAKAAARYLTTMGIAARRLSTISFGKEKPADPGHDETAWARNRRDEFVIAK